MAIDNIQTLNGDRSIKEVEGKSIYSINLTQKTLDKVKRLMNEKNKLTAETRKIIQTAIDNNAPIEQVVGKSIIAAANIVSLRDEIEILTMPTKENNEATELVGTRAIKLIDKMIKEVKKKSDFIYAPEEKKEEPVTVPETTPVVVEIPTIGEPPVVDVQQIAAENKEAVSASIENAISENDIKEVIGSELGVVPPAVVPTTEAIAIEPTPITEAEISEVVNNELNVVPTVVETPTEPVVNIEEPIIEKATESVIEEAPVVTPVVETVTEPVMDDVTRENIINEKVNSFVNESKSIANNMENEYVPMTDEEIARAQENIELEKYNEIYAAEVKKSQEVAEANEAKGFDMDELPLRDEIQVVPEREEEISKKIDENVQEEVEEPKLVEENEEEPRSVVVPEWEKEKLESHKEESLEELAELYKAEMEIKKQKEREKAASEEELQGIKENYARLLENETAVEKQLEELAAEEEEKKNRVKELKEKISKEYELTRNENSSLEADIKRNYEEFSSIKEDGDRRNERLEGLNKEASSKQERIAQLDEMIAKYGYIEESDSIQKTK